MLSFIRCRAFQVQGTCKQQIAPPPLSYPAREKRLHICGNHGGVLIRPKKENIAHEKDTVFFK